MCDAPGCDYTQTVDKGIIPIGEPMISDPPPEGWRVFMLIDPLKGINASEEQPVICPHCARRIMDCFREERRP